jgi:predicted amidohydrolase YtcJ
MTDEANIFRSLLMRLFLLAAAATLAACSGPAPATPADPGKITVFTNGLIYTGLEDPATVEGVIVGADGRILATIPPMSADWGDDEGELNIIDLGGAVMFPGFTDAHAHLLGIGQRELTLNLEGTASIDELVTRTEIELTEKAPGEILFGRGWIETGWPDGRMPSAVDLDQVSPENPVIYVRADGHALVANTLALKAAGIHDETPDPAGGHVERGADGKATGIVIDNAMTPVMKLVAEPSEADLLKAYQTGAET